MRDPEKVKARYARYNASTKGRDRRARYRDRRPGNVVSSDTLYQAKRRLAEHGINIVR